jgi:hypothetical protein
MSRNGSGTYTLPAGNPVVTGTTISSTWANNTLTDIATALTGSLAADGQTTATGNLKLGANRITGLADGIAATDAATVNQIPDATTFLLKASNLSDVANATTARGNLTAAKSGANSDITSLTACTTITGLTTPLTVAQGGTGASTLTANNVLLGNGTSAPQVVAPSTSGNVLTSNGTTWTSAAGANPLTSGTAVASTSGTSIDFTSIPSWVKRVTVLFRGVSTNGTSDYLIQIGAGSPTTTGYTGSASVITTGVATSNFTTGFGVYNNIGAGTVIDGSVTISAFGSNVWIASGVTAITSAIGTMPTGGAVTLGGTLDRIRITTVNGTDTFDAGSINILYE